MDDPNLNTLRGGTFNPTGVPHSSSSITGSVGILFLGELDVVWNLDCLNDIELDLVNYRFIA